VRKQWHPYAGFIFSIIDQIVFEMTEKKLSQFGQMSEKVGW